MATVTALKKEKQQAFDINDVLAGATTEKPKATASKVPVLATPDKELQEKATRIREIKEQLDSLESELDVLASEVTETVEPLRAEIIKAKGYNSSVKIPDTNGMYLTLTWLAKYSKTPLDNKGTLENILGEDYGNYIDQRMVIKVKDVSENSLKDLIASVGAERFSQFFEVERWLEPTRRYTEEFYTALDRVRQQLAGIIRQYKPSIKTK